MRDLLRPGTVGAVNLLDQRSRARAAARAARRAALSDRLREILPRFAPGCEFWVFGSLLDPAKFTLASDVDLAYDHLPPGETEYSLTGRLEEALGCRVDLVDLQRSRLRAKILRTGQRWTT